MIKATVRIQFQKMAGIVAVTTFSVRRCMEFGFTDGGYTIVTFAAISKYFLMIDKRDDVVSLRGMAGLAHVTGSNVIRHFGWYKFPVANLVHAIVTITAI